MLFLDVAAGEGRQQLVLLEQAVREAFGSAGLRPHDSRPFQPHVTIAKMSKMKGRRTWLLGMGGAWPPVTDGATCWCSPRHSGADISAIPAACCVAGNCNSSASDSGTSDSSALHWQAAADLWTTRQVSTEHTALPCAAGGRAKVRHIPAEAYAEHLDIDGGVAVVEEVQICCMEGRKAGQYYVVQDRLVLAAVEHSRDDAIS